MMYHFNHPRTIGLHLHLPISRDQVALITRTIILHHPALTVSSDVRAIPVVQAHTYRCISVVRGMDIAIAWRAGCTVVLSIEYPKERSNHVLRPTTR